MKLLCVYHIGAINRIATQNIVNDQLNTLIESGLMEKLDKVYYSIIGKNKDKIELNHYKYHKIYESYDSSKCEVPAMEFIYKLSCKNPDAYIFYFHTKGIISETNKWRKLMEYCCIYNHKICINLLDMNFYTVGCLMQQNHYQGNFWWARCDYITKKQKIKVNPIINTIRCGWGCEFWIMNPPHYNKHVSLYQIKSLFYSFPPNYVFGNKIGLYNEKNIPTNPDICVYLNQKISYKLFYIIIIFIILLVIMLYIKHKKIINFYYNKYDHRNVSN